MFLNFFGLFSDIFVSVILLFKFLDSFAGFDTYPFLLGLM